MPMKVCEIFTSIQGESRFAGMPCTFIRMTGCNLRCTYCDTKYAYYKGEDLSEKSIIKRINKAGVKLIEVTGGEPLLQEGVRPLIAGLLDEGYDVLVETNGSLPINTIDSRAIVILDIKTPGSGMTDKMDLSNIDFIKKKDEIKFVIADMIDYRWTRDFILTHDLIKKCYLLLSPAYGFLDPKDLAEWMIEDRLQARLNLQLHKYIFGPIARGK